jgi:hypothetical protein
VEGLGEIITLIVVVLCMAVAAVGIWKGVKDNTEGLMWTGVALIIFSLICLLVLLFAK